MSEPVNELHARQICHHSGDDATLSVTMLEPRAVARMVTASYLMTGSDIKGKYPNGLRNAMEAANIGVTALANAVATNKQNIQRWADQSRKLPLDMARRIANHLNRLPAEILMPPDMLNGLNRVRLLALVSAGRLGRDDIQEEELGSLLIAGLPKGDWIALRVDGDSMDRISPPESVILVNRRDRKLVPNACYVITDAEGNATYKRFRPSPRPRFEPVSSNQNIEPIFPEDTPITIIGRVRRTMLDM